MSFEVQLSENAEAELDQILGGLAVYSTPAAERLAGKFWRAIEQLQARPFTGGLAFENELFSVELRHLLFWINPRRKYRALYFIQGNVVQIVTIRAPGQGPVQPNELGFDR